MMNESAEKRIHQVLKMADRIDAFIEEQSWHEEVALHVDITGDVRYASMMMLRHMDFEMPRHSKGRCPVATGMNSRLKI